MLSAFADNSIGPIVATVCVIIVFTILTQMEIPFYDAVKPYLFTTHMLGWKGFFYVRGVDGVTVDGSIENPGAIIKSGMVLLAYIAAFLLTATLYFRKKNILS
jgi:ABC-2 type transport system permease protein